MESYSGLNSLKLSKSERKIAKKKAKACHVLYKHDGIKAVTNPTCNLLVANGGLGNGVSRDEIQHIFGSVGLVKDTLMLRDKPYCFVTYGEVTLAKAAMQRLNGYELRDGEGPTRVTLYLSYVENVPNNSEGQTSLPPPGLVLIPDFINEQVEQDLIASIDWDLSTEAENQSLKHRRVKHHGYKFNYSTNNIDKDEPLPEGIPALYSQIIDRIMETGQVRFRPDQLTINQYQSGQGIPPHVDTHSAFEDAIISLSLGSQVMMEFTHPDGRHVGMVLPSRSLLIMTGEARYMWSHGITPRKSDVVPDPTSPDNLTLHQRGQRTSFTFRAVRHVPCNCDYPSQCDSQKAQNSASILPQVSFPKSEEEAARMEAEQVHAVYNQIADHFSGTRYKPWPKVVDFLNGLQPGSVVLDVGCGNGKYLGINKNLYMVGCDRSDQLIDICKNRGLEGFVCDSLSLPVGDASMDACICIAVIHHMSTEARRLQALMELTRVLRPGGKALVTVWAMEQERMREKSKYISRTKNGKAKYDSGNCSDAKQSSENGQVPTMASGTDETCNHCSETSKLLAKCEVSNVNDQCSNCSDVRTTSNENTKVAAGEGQFKTIDSNVVMSENRNIATEQEQCKCYSDARKTVEEQHFHDPQMSASEDRTDQSRGVRKERTEEQAGDSLIAVHKNRTQFEEQDLLVPWHLHKRPLKTSSEDNANEESGGNGQQKNVFYRFYHVFVEGEMQRLCQTVDGIKVVDSYYDQGNWCVVFQKQ